MQNYINQLLGDLSELISYHQTNMSSESLLVMESESSDDLLEFAKLSIQPDCSFADILEIQQEQLPPSDKLSDRQISALFDSLNDALIVFQCFLDFPDKISNRKKYTILRSYWNEPQLICNKSVNTIDFCDYDQEHCVYGSEGCECKRLENLG